MKRKEFEIYLDKDSLEKLRVRLQIENGVLLDVVYQYESYIQDTWVPIVRYDCAHGFFHRDVMWPNGDKEKHEIVIEDLKSASAYAQQDLKDRWEWYKERFIKKIKR